VCFGFHAFHGDDDVHAQTQIDETFDENQVLGLVRQFADETLIDFDLVNGQDF
jgi:hypothetical protein